MIHWWWLFSNMQTEWWWFSLPFVKACSCRSILTFHMFRIWNLSLCVYRNINDIDRRLTQAISLSSILWPWHITRPVIVWSHCVYVATAPWWLLIVGDHHVTFPNMTTLQTTAFSTYLSAGASDDCNWGQTFAWRVLQCGRAIAIRQLEITAFLAERQNNRLSGSLHFVLM